MKCSERFAARKVIPAVLVAVLVLGLATIAYANNIGGIAYEPDGSERPLTAEELIEELNPPSVEYEQDGLSLEDGSKNLIDDGFFIVVSIMK